MGLYIVCLVTINDPEIAAQIARSLVERRLAACANIIPNIRSVYVWKGKICDDAEVLMLIKTRGDLFDQLVVAIRELHPYELPEIISLPIQSGLQDYLQWIHDATAADQ